jgi:DNA topoisomerase I
MSQKTLIIVESPSKAKTINQYVGKDYVVKASVGHIRQISNSKTNDKGDKLEINGIDINNDFKAIYEVDPDKKKVVNELKKLAKEADSVLFATDEDREGEAISWHLAEVLKLDSHKLKRLVFHEITKKAITNALDNLRLLDQNLVAAQQARQVLDKLVGYKLSPVLWSVMNNRKLSAGRVQSPALRLVVERELEIRAFVAEEYWEVFGTFDDTARDCKGEIILDKQENKAEFNKKVTTQDFLKLSSYNGNKIDPKNLDRQKIEKIVQSLHSHPVFEVISSNSKPETVRSKPPFTTSTLQQAASSRLGYAPKQAMRLAQKLYEGITIDGHQVGLITYMRTDSTNLSADSLEAARTYIGKHYPDSLPEKAKFYKSKSRNAQEAHEAIRPTDPLRTPDSIKGKIDPQEWKLYDLIWRQMIASQMSDEVRIRFTIELENQAKDCFKGSVAWTIKAGFKAVLGNIKTVDDPEKLQASFSLGSQKYLDQLLAMQYFTAPPSRYSAASLIKKLEELGIGRPSTYASIISTLHDREYVESIGSSIAPTSLGERIATLLIENFTEVTEAQLTAQLENQLDKISLGEATYLEVLKAFWQDFDARVESKKLEITDFKQKYQSQETEVEDPKFGDKMVLKVGRFGEYYQNPNHPEVMYPKNFRELAIAEKQAQIEYAEQAEGLKCDCGKDLIVRVSKATLNAYIACPDYRVGNKHTVRAINFGDCPKCEKEARTGKLIKRKFKGREYFACSEDKKVCGYTQPIKKEA